FIASTLRRQMARADGAARPTACGRLRPCPRDTAPCVGLAAEIVAAPMADGGEGVVDALIAATGGSDQEAGVTGPLGTLLDARFGLLGDGRTAVVEMAAAAGLALVPVDRRDPRRTTTRGVGELILAAARKGVRRLIVGIGGSATNDGGAGMAQALGFRLLDARGRDLGPGGGALNHRDSV
ncbi:hypothetical protein HK102_014191, partial [Quaeritorhiza haematococci]